MQVSFVGYKTLTKEVEIKSGENILDLTLENENIKLNVVTVTSQKREQQILDVPNTGSLFGDPTRIPGEPRMFGAKIN